MLGLQRELLTAAAYGVRRFLFVYGDKPAEGGRTSELTVRAMVEQTRAASEDPRFAGSGPFQVGVAAGLRPVPEWKRAADFVFAQVSFSLDALLRWRDEVSLDVPVYAGVMVLAGAGMARNLAAAIPDIDIPDSLVTAVESDRDAGWTRHASRCWRFAPRVLSTGSIWCRSVDIGRLRPAWKACSESESWA